jgi:hypothetical protein
VRLLLNASASARTRFRSRSRDCPKPRWRSPRHRSMRPAAPTAREETVWRFARLDRLRASRPRPGARIDFAPNSLLRSKRRKQFPARANKFPARPRRGLCEFALQATEFADVFETDFREKAADSAKFPAFFPVTRELCTSGDREFIHGKPQRSLLSGTGHARKRCGARAASYSMNGWIPLSRE